MRIRSLDALRGVAALIVAFHHIAELLPPAPHITKYSPLRILFAGEQAVFVFFILSGFVLFLALGKGGERTAILPFYLKRICRIYLPFCAAVALSAALWLVIRPHGIPGLSAFFDKSWGVSLTWTVIAGHLAMTDVPSWQSLDPVMWSLAVELRISFLFPILAALVHWNWRGALIISLVVSELCFVAHNMQFSLGQYDLIHTGMFCYLFVVGATLALHAASIRRWFDVAPKVSALLWVVALFLFSISPERFGSLLTAVGASLVLALSLGDTGTKRVLETRPAEWLGRVSYSLYLIHVPIMLASIYVLDGVTPPLVALLIGLGVAMAMSEVMYRLVEMPSIAAGRLAARLVGPAREQTV